MKTRLAQLTLCVACVCTTLSTATTAQEAPYAGQQYREVSSFSDSDIEDLFAGAGWGLAKPAELNGWPGPAHVIELADELNLSLEQREKVEKIFGAMNAAAREAGADLIAAETALDHAFESGQIDDERLLQLLTASEVVRTRLRMFHLSAHLKVGPILNMHQKMLYEQARGYTGDSAHNDHGGHN